MNCRSPQVENGVGPAEVLHCYSKFLQLPQERRVDCKVDFETYCEILPIEPTGETHMLFSLFDEGGDGDALKARVANLVRQDVNVITLLALSDDGRPAYDNNMAEDFAALGSPVFACTPDQFPGLMATALKREDVLTWAADQDIKAVRPAENA